MFSSRFLLLALAGLLPLRALAQNVVPEVTAQIADSTLLEGAAAQVVALPDFFNDPDTTGVRLTTVLGNIDVALYDQQKPVTTANFKNYLNSGRYFATDPTTGLVVSTFFHRSVPGFVIQSGGFLSTVDPADPVHVKPTQVPAFAAIANETGISNTRGTIAMARLADPNTATSQYFINLADNGGPPNNLDTINGGYAVFGRVLGDGMTVADAIAAVPIFDGTFAAGFGSAFAELPLRDFTSGLPSPANMVSIPGIGYISSLTFTAVSDQPNLVGVTISGSNLLVTPKLQGTATITVTGTDVDGAPIAQSFDVTVIANPVHLANISTRALVGTGDDALIGGFIVRGTAPKRVVIRALGPSLGAAGITNFLADPTLEIHDGTGATIASNDNWQSDANQQALVDAGLAPSQANEASILLDLPADDTGLNYTAIVSGAGTGTGVGLVEVYDLDAAPGSSVLNISTRGDVQTGDNVMIGGFIVFGEGSQRVLIRAIGPSLANFDIPSPLSDPTLSVFDSQGTPVDSNDNWQDNPEKDAIEATTIPPNDPLESAVLQTLAPGGYTAIVSGAGGATGTALVEVYVLTP
ncbi:MAG: peptidylprolyl isomerase [Chthoniobacterales bacterium]|nr:peptidylprolyl isomerase [Chthoniobacterales bacterium]